MDGNDNGTGTFVVKRKKKDGGEAGTRRNLHSIPGIIDQFDSRLYSNVPGENVALFRINRNPVIRRAGSFLSFPPPLAVYILTLPFHLPRGPETSPARSDLDFVAEGKRARL